jgi:pyrroline-5-carboxylate reductase
MASQRPDRSLADLRDSVASPGGVTAEGLYVLDKGGLAGLLQEALEAAAVKSRRLS